MADRFSDWERFQRHNTLIQDPKKALEWTRYEMWAEKRRLRNLQDEADRLALASQLKANGVR